MTTPTSTTTDTATGDAVRPRPSTLLRVAAVLAALLAIADLAGALIYMGNPMPVEIGVGIIVISVLTLVGAAFAFVGRPWGVWLAVVTRVLSIGAMIPVFTEPEAPAEAVVPSIIQIVVTVVVIVLLIIGLLRKRAS